MNAPGATRSAVSGPGRRPTSTDQPGRPLAAIAWGALAATCGVGLMATSGWLIARASQRPPIFTLSVAMGAVQAFALGRGLARYFQRLGVHDAALERLGRARMRLYDVVEPLVPGGLHDHGQGSVLSGFVADTEVVAEGFAKRVTAATDVAATVVVAAAVTLAAAAPLVPVLVVAAAVTVAVALAAGRLGRAAAAREAASRAELAGVVVETVSSARELVAFGRQDLVEASLEGVRRRSGRGAARRARAVGAGRAAVTLAAGAGLIAFVAVGLGAVDAHRVSAVTLVALTLAALITLDQCAALPTVLADTNAADAASARLAALDAIPPPANETGDAGPPPPRPAGPGTAELDRATVVSGSTPRLRDVSLRVGDGRRVALVGPSGAGKTSAVHALLHFVECDSGRATLDGVDVRALSRADLSRRIGWMAEDTHVFSATLGDNLRLARPAATETDCLAALRRVGLDAWLASLPAGLATVVGAGGRPMSAGERQRLGLARALLAGGGVLLLDEPTTHLDPLSSDGVLAELIGAAGARSVLVVSHEPGIGRHVDEVVRLERAAVADQAGTTGSGS